MKTIIAKLKAKGKTISTMESCTGGGLANAITNIEGASDVFKFSAVTYSNEFKIQMGVNPKIIDKYSVYSFNTSEEMSKKIAEFTGSNYGIGITGKLNRTDKHNPSQEADENNNVYISIYDADKDYMYNYGLKVNPKSRQKVKDDIINFIIEKLKEII